jgi:hypothetical protein
MLFDPVPPSRFSGGRLFVGVVMDAQLVEIISKIDQVIYLMQILVVGVCFNSAFVFCKFILHAKNQRDFI